MSENHENRYQLRAAAKAFEWLRRSKPAVGREEQKDEARVSRCRPMNGIAEPPVPCRALIGKR